MPTLSPYEMMPPLPGGADPPASPSTATVSVFIPYTGPLGLTIEQLTDDSCRVKSVVAGTQAEAAGVKEGDVPVWAGEKISYEIFLEMCKHGARPLAFTVERDVSQANGAVNFTYPNGDCYEGEYRDGKRHGQGKFTWASGESYNGKWKDCKKQHGEGKYTWAGGNVYDGQWKNDNRHGHGKMKFANGGFYNGHWEDDKRHWKGRHLYASGSIYVGGWKENQKHGNGKCTTADGKVHEGEYKDDKKNGKGKLTLGDGDVFEGIWCQDRQHGEFTVTKATGTIFKEVYRYGSKLLPSKQFSPLDEDRFSRRACSLVLTLGEEDITCGICNAEYSSNLSEDDENIRRHLPVLGSCGHHCCHGCALEVQAAHARENNGRVPERIKCMTCRAVGAFRPGEPTYFRVLADFIERSTTYARPNCLCGMLENASLSDL